MCAAHSYASRSELLPHRLGIDVLVLSYPSQRPALLIENGSVVNLALIQATVPHRHTHAAQMLGDRYTMDLETLCQAVDSGPCLVPGD